MNITEIRIREVQKPDGRLCAVASITIDNSFVVHDIKIIKKDDSYIIGMPSRKTAEGEYKDIAHPVNLETRNELKEKILNAYFNQIKAN